MKFIFTISILITVLPQIARSETNCDKNLTKAPSIIGTALSQPNLPEFYVVLDEPLSASDRQAVDKQLLALDQKWQNTAKSRDWIAELADEMATIRMSKSTTLMDHVAPGKTDKNGLPRYDKFGTKMRALWQKANAKLESWIQSGDEPSFRRLIELNQIVENKRFDSRRASASYLRTSFIGRGAAAEDLPTAIKDFDSWYQANKEHIHPIELATLAYERLITLHPFPNGNGRTLEFLMTWILRMHGYPPALVVKSVDQVGPQINQQFLMTLERQPSRATELSQRQVLENGIRGVLNGIELVNSRRPQ